MVKNYEKWSIGGQPNVIRSFLMEIPDFKLGDAELVATHFLETTEVLLPLLKEFAGFLFTSLSRISQLLFRISAFILS